MIDLQVCCALMESPLAGAVHLAILLYPGVDEAEVGAALALIDRVHRLAPGRLQTYTLARDTMGLRCGAGLHVLPDYSFASAPAIDAALICGGTGAIDALKDDETLRFLRRLRKHAAMIAGSNTGVLPLVAAGLFRERRVAAVGNVAELTGRATSVTAVADAFVIDGPMVSARGPDAARRIIVHLVGEIYDEITVRALTASADEEPA